MEDNNQNSEELEMPFTDIPYQPPSKVNPRQARVLSGKVGAQQVGNNQSVVGDGKRDNQIYTSAEEGREMIRVGTAIDPKVVIGQLEDVTGNNEYGIWTNNGYFTGVIVANAGLIGGWYINSDSIASDEIEANAGILLDPVGEEIRVGDLSGNYIIIDGANAEIVSSDYVAGSSGFLVSADLIEANNLRARGMMNGATFKYDVISSVGGQMMVANSDVLEVDMTALDSSTVTISGATTLALDDILLMRADNGAGIVEEWMRVTNIASAPIYTVDRDLAGVFGANANPAWTKGTTIVVQGNSDGVSSYDGGWLRLIGEGLNSPYYSVFVRDGVDYDDYMEALRIGNLNGIGGKVVDTYGIFIGDISTGNYLIYDTLSGTLTVNGMNFASNPAFGDGSDGDLTINFGNTVTQTRDMFWDNGTINGTLKPNGFKWFFKGTLDIGVTGVIERNGNNGGNGGAGGAGDQASGNGGAAGTAGASGAALAAGSLAGSPAGPAGQAGQIGGGGGGPATPGLAGNNGTNGTNGGAATSCLGDPAVNGVNGVGGGNGGGGSFGGGSAGTGGTGGTAGTYTAASSGVRNLSNALSMIDSAATPAPYSSSPSSGGSAGSGSGSGGGGHSGSHAGANGGGGGGSGGAGGVGSPGGVILGAARILNIAAGGVISANAGAAGNGGVGGAGANADIVTASSNGGGGGGGGGSAASGANGGLIVLIFQEMNNLGTIEVNGSLAGTPGSGGAGGLGGTSLGTGGGNDGASGPTGLTANDGVDGLVVLLPIS
jgi:hypothetical protein